MLLETPADAPFSELVGIAKLNPATDLRHADLRCVDLSNSDLRGYDFTGSDLRGAGGIKVTFDSTTITDHADIDGSIFATRENIKSKLVDNKEASEIAHKLTRESWTDQLTWCNINYINGSKHNEIFTDVATFLYQNSTSKYTRSQIIPLISKRFSGNDRFNFLISAIAQDDDTIVSRFALEQLISNKLGENTAAHTAALRLVYSKRSQTQMSAIKFLVRFAKEKDNFDEIRKIVKGNLFLETVYVSEVSSNLGPSFQLVTRDPHSNESFALKKTVDRTLLRRIAVRWLRAEDQVRRGKGVYTILDMPRSATNLHFNDILQKEREIIQMWDKMNYFGIKIVVLN